MTSPDPTLRIDFLKITLISSSSPRPDPVNQIREVYQGLYHHLQLDHYPLPQIQPVNSQYHWTERYHQYEAVLALPASLCQEAVEYLNGQRRQLVTVEPVQTLEPVVNSERLSRFRSRVYAKFDYDLGHYYARLIKIENNNNLCI